VYEDMFGKPNNRTGYKIVIGSWRDSE